MRCPKCSDNMKDNGVYAREVVYYCKNCERYFQISEVTEFMNSLSRRKD